MGKAEIRLPIDGNLSGFECGGPELKVVVLEDRRGNGDSGGMTLDFVQEEVRRVVDFRGDWELEQAAKALYTVFVMAGIY